MNTAQPQIVAIGGGGLSPEPDNFAIERHVMKHARRERPAVCYVGTASGDDDAYTVRFYGAFAQLECRPTHLPFFRRTPELRQMLLAQDIIYVGGGNTKSMLAVWRDWGLPEILREAWQAGTILCGTSAGAICWFETGVTDSWADSLYALPCLGFLPGVCCPHYDGEKERKPSVHRMVNSGELASVLALDDGAAAHFEGAYENARLARVVTSRPKAGAYMVQRGAQADGPALEEALAVEYLGEEQK